MKLKAAKSFGLMGPSFNDSKGYQGSTQRRMGKTQTKLAAPPIPKPHPGIAPKKAAMGRGGPALVKGKGLAATMSSAAFEQLGAK